ncbi:MAG: amino acid ABC transporter substrate-binding protein [Geminicoccaceae bacterium]
MRRLLALAVALLGLAATAEAGVLDKVKQTGQLTLGYRNDAMPFSYENAKGEPAGYSVDLCLVVAEQVRQTLKLDKLDVRYQIVDAKTRFDQLKAGKVDLLCGADTVTLARRQVVDFSLMTFASGSTLLYRVDGPQTFKDLKGQKIGARAGTITVDTLRKALADQNFDAQLVPYDDYEAGVRDLAAGKLAAFFGDGGILLFQWLQSPDKAKLKLSERSLSNEPYALVLPRGDDDFRLVVDTALAGVYRSKAIEKIFTSAFGAQAKPADIVRAVYLLNALEP